ncbi:MAG: hypothetical protein IJ877_01575 [Candidatus Gastranaerophilales bacterium]|nr:hypothetical protein [Candidatus Gastranaerophilales bacterium]
MQFSRNEEYLLKFISCADINNDLLDMISKLGLKPQSREYNPVYQIIDELTFSDVFKEQVLK